MPATLEEEKGEAREERRLEGKKQSRRSKPGVKEKPRELGVDHQRQVQG